MDREKVKQQLENSTLPSIMKEVSGDKKVAPLSEFVSTVQNEEEMPKPPPIPADAPPLQDVVRQLASNPNWMEEKKLKKVFLFLFFFFFFFLFSSFFSSFFSFSLFFLIFSFFFSLPKL